MKFAPKRKFMNIALKQARLAFDCGDYPIGSCIVRDNEVIAVSSNRVKSKDDSTRHTELEIIQYVVGMQNGPYLEDCILYTTHEPCPMCSGAAVWSRLGGIVYGNSINDFKNYTKESNYLKWRVIDIPSRTITKDSNIEIHGPFMNKQCLELFKLKRKTC